MYVALAGLSNQLVELTASGTEVTTVRPRPLTGDNGSSVPFDTPCNATFLGTSVLVANQSADRRATPRTRRSSTCTSARRGQPAYLPETATF